MNDAGDDVSEIAPELGSDDCKAQGGVYFAGSVLPGSIQTDPNSDWVYAMGMDGFGNDQWSCPPGGSCDSDSLSAFEDSLWGLGQSITIASITVTAGSTSTGSDPGWTPGPQNCPWLGFGCTTRILNDQKDADEDMVKITAPFILPFELMKARCELAKVNSLAARNVAIDYALLGQDLGGFRSQYPGLSDATIPAAGKLNDLRNGNLREIERILGTCHP